MLIWTGASPRTAAAGTKSSGGIGRFSPRPAAGAPGTPTAKHSEPALVCPAVSKIPTLAPPGVDVVNPPTTLSNFKLTDQNGKPLQLSDLKGKLALMTFGFTHCPDVCPTTLVKLARVKQAGALPGVQVLFVSVDPQRDTPTALGLYVHAFDPDFIGLTGEASAIKRIATEFGVAVSRVDLSGGDYTMDHSAVVFLLDRRGRMVGVFTPPFDIQRMAQDLRRAAAFLIG